MKIINGLKLIALFLIIETCVFGSGLTADAILQEVDEHRLVGDSFEMTIRVENFRNNQFESSTVMNGFVSDGQMTMLAFLEPENMKGRKMIIEANEMRLIIPNVKNPVRITASQRLVGGISYGDVAAVSYAKHYVPRLIGAETVPGMKSDGTESEPVQCYVLELSARETKANYHKIILWVENQNYLPVKGDFLALSGKKMTTVYYTAAKEWHGKNIITKMFLFDQVNTDRYYSMEYSNFKATR